MIEFFLPVIPFKASHHHKKIIKIGKFVRLGDKPELQKARQTYESLLMPLRPQEPLRGAIMLELAFCFPFLKSHSKKFKLSTKRKTTKPDISNLTKTFEDCLVRMGFFEDDSQVAKLSVSKYFTDKVGIRVRISEIPEEVPSGG